MSEIDTETMDFEQAKEYFDKNYNIGYVDESLPTPDNELVFKHYISSALIYGFALLFLLFNPFYTVQFNGKYELNIFFIYTYIAYMILAPIFLLIFRPRTLWVSHSIEVINYVLKIVKRQGLEKGASSKELLKWFTPTYRQKQSIILYFIKFFFAPQMILASYVHFHGIEKVINMGNLYFSKDIFANSELILRCRDISYVMLLEFMYFIDCFVYAIGYCTELTIFNNRIRTVESSALGLIFCLACYPLISELTIKIVPWKHQETTFSCLVSEPMSILIWICMLLVLVLLFIYTSSSVALFTKASNLTNRGVVTCFPYNVVRHPAYISKVSIWIVGTLCVFKALWQRGDFAGILLVLISMSTWIFIYYMRAITEERHLSLDPEYREYCKKVKYRFIPYVW